MTSRSTQALGKINERHVAVRPTLVKRGSWKKTCKLTIVTLCVQSAIQTCNMSSSSTCQMSPSASAFSTMLSAFVGSVINGFSSGFAVAFITGWISWFAVLRIIAGGLYELFLAFRSGTEMSAIDKAEYSSVALNDFGRLVNAPSYSVDQEQSANAQERPSRFGAGARLPMMKSIERTVTIPGWLGWMWSAIYAPISQSIWIFVHLTSEPPTTGINLCIRGLAIGVSALGLTIDYRARYGVALGRKLGAWAFMVFNVWNATACLVLGGEALFLLIHGAMRLTFPGRLPLLVLYPVFCVIWAGLSWRLLPPIDGARPSNVILGILMGAFAGIFVAAPGFALWQRAKFDARSAQLFGEVAPQGLSLSEFLQCQGAGVLAKFAAVMP